MGEAFCDVDWRIASLARKLQIIEVGRAPRERLKSAIAGVAGVFWNDTGEGMNSRRFDDAQHPNGELRLREQYIHIGNYTEKADRKIGDVLTVSSPMEKN